MKKAIVNGQEIGEEAVNFELDRLVRFYMSHGMSIEEVKQNLLMEHRALARKLNEHVGAQVIEDIHFY